MKKTSPYIILCTKPNLNSSLYKSVQNNQYSVNSEYWKEDWIIVTDMDFVIIWWEKWNVFSDNRRETGEDGQNRGKKIELASEIPQGIGILNLFKARLNFSQYLKLVNLILAFSAFPHWPSRAHPTTRKDKYYSKFQVSFSLFHPTFVFSGEWCEKIQIWTLWSSSVNSEMFTVIIQRQERMGRTGVRRLSWPQKSPKV